MGKRFDFTGYLADERDKIAKSLTDEENAVFEQRARGASVVETSMRLSLGEATVKRRSASIQKKIQRMHARSRRSFGETEKFLEISNKV